MEKLLDMLKRHEGVETHAYECSAGKITVGVGRNIDQAGGIGLTEDEIDYLLQNDIERVMLELVSEYDWFNDLDDVRKGRHDRYSLQPGTNPVAVIQTRLGGYGGR